MSQTFYKQIYRFPEGYRILADALRTLPNLMRARRLGLIEPAFFERIMLAVTEVNGCEVCTTGHTKMAVDAGLQLGEIKTLLTGDLSGVPDEEKNALDFARLYAQNRGKSSADAFVRLVGRYGHNRATGILGAVRMIMAGNAYGIPLSALKSRFKGQPVVRDGLGFAYEVGMLLSLIVLIPAAAVHALWRTLWKAPLI